MKKNLPFIWKITYSHTIAYFIAGVLAMNIMDYANFFSLEINSFMRPLEAPIIGIAPLLQIFRGFCIGLILLPLRKTFFEDKRCLLKLGLLMIGFSLLFTFAAAPGSFEGFIYTIIPVKNQIIGYPEAIVYFSLFILLLHVSNKYGHKKIINISAIAVMVLIGFMSIMGFMVKAGKINIPENNQVEHVEVFLLSEGEREGNTDILIGATPEMLHEALPDGSFTSTTNVFLVRISGKNILIDAGYGRNLFDNLQTHGIDTEQIDAVLITHAHGDHIGGLLHNEEVSFPNATLYLAQAEYDFWMCDEAMNNESENRQNGFLNARKVFELYKEHLHLFTPDELDAEVNMLMPNIRAIAACGHTPGHTVYLVNADKQPVLIWGDLTHAQPVQMRFPQLAVVYDTDPEQAVTSRLLILDYVTKNKIHIAGMHIASPGMGVIKENPEGGYLFIP